MAMRRDAMRFRTFSHTLPFLTSSRTCNSIVLLRAASDEKDRRLQRADDDRRRAVAEKAEEVDVAVQRYRQEQEQLRKKGNRNRPSKDIRNQRDGPKTQKQNSEKQI